MRLVGLYFFCKTLKRNICHKSQFSLAALLQLRERPRISLPRILLPYLLRRKR